jgi:hypothetical protein
VNSQEPSFDLYEIRTGVQDYLPAIKSASQVAQGVTPGRRHGKRRGIGVRDDGRLREEVRKAAVWLGERST